MANFMILNELAAGIVNGVIGAAIVLVAVWLVEWWGRRSPR